MSAIKDQPEHTMSSSDTSRVAAERSVREMFAARGRYEEEMIRLHQRVESEEKQMQERVADAESRERAAKERAAQLEARVRELENQTQELKDVADDVRADAYRLGEASTRTNTKLEGQLKIYQEKLKVANDLQEMFRDTAQTLQDELTNAHARVESAITQEATSPSWGPIYNQELQKANEENMKLEVKLHHQQTRLQQLELTELINETLQADKDRLKAKVERMGVLHEENIKLNAKVRNLELKARVWTTFTKTAESQTPQQLARHMAELESRIELSNDLSETLQNIIQIQKTAAGRAQVLDAQVKMLELQLEESVQRESKLKLQLSTSQARVGILENHLAGKPIDLSPIDVLSERVDAIPVKDTSNKRSLDQDEDDVLDKLATKLTQSERRAMDTQQKLTMALKDIDALKAEAALKSGPLPAAAVVELKGSPQDKSNESLTEQLQGLERENEALKKQLAGENIRTVPLESISVLHNRLERAKSEAETKHEGLDQLLRGFRSKVTDTKSAERAIFGYELELKNNVTCLVRSDYAIDGIDTTLDKSVNFFEILYEPVSQKFSEISCNSLLRQYDELYQVWVKQRKYLPGFLASVLLQNYEKYSK